MFVITIAPVSSVTLHATSPQGKPRELLMDLVTPNMNLENLINCKFLGIIVVYALTGDFAWDLTNDVRFLYEMHTVQNRIHYPVLSPDTLYTYDRSTEVIYKVPETEYDNNIRTLLYNALVIRMYVTLTILRKYEGNNIIDASPIYPKDDNLLMRADPSNAPQNNHLYLIFSKPARQSVHNLYIHEIIYFTKINKHTPRLLDLFNDCADTQVLEYRNRRRTDMHRDKTIPVYSPTGNGLWIMFFDDVKLCSTDTVRYCRRCSIPVLANTCVICGKHTKEGEEREYCTYNCNGSLVMIAEVTYDPLDPNDISAVVPQSNAYVVYADLPRVYVFFRRYGSNLQVQFMRPHSD
jgi:hypothetical protein